MALLDRHIAFLEALRSAGLPVSLSEGLDAADAMLTLGLEDRELLRAAYAGTLVKKQPHRAGFDHVFDLYFPALVGDPTRAESVVELAETSEDIAASSMTGAGDGPAELAEF